MRLLDWLTGRTALRRLVADLLQANAALRGQLAQAERRMLAQQRVIEAARGVIAEAIQDVGELERAESSSGGEST